MSITTSVPDEARSVRRPSVTSVSRADFVFTRRGGVLYALPVTLFLLLMPVLQPTSTAPVRYLSGSSWGDAGLGALMFLALFGIVWTTVNSHRRMRVCSGAEAALATWPARRR